MCSVKLYSSKKTSLKRNKIKKQAEAFEITKLKAIQDYFKTCPYLNSSGYIDLNYLDSEPFNYSISLNGTETTYREYTDGGAIRQILFYFTFVVPLDRSEMLKNSTFNEDLDDWIEQQNDICNFPLIDGCLSIESLTTGELEQTSETTAVYTRQIRVLYEYN